MNAKLTIFALLCFVAYSMGHLCMANPTQRGGLWANSTTVVGSMGFFIHTPNGPCGGTAAGASVATYTINVPFVATLILNEQHINVSVGVGGLYWSYCTSNCGVQASFVNFTTPAIADSTAYVPPMNISSTLTFPKGTATGAIVMQATYITTVSNLWPAAFYQCADVTLASSASMITFSVAAIFALIVALF